MKYWKKQANDAIGTPSHYWVPWNEDFLKRARYAYRINREYATYHQMRIHPLVDLIQEEMAVIQGNGPPALVNEPPENPNQMELQHMQNQQAHRIEGWPHDRLVAKAVYHRNARDESALTMQGLAAKFAAENIPINE